MTPTIPLFISALIYLVTFMPEKDRLTVSEEYLIVNTQLAVEAYESAPWHDTVSRELFFEYILPYSSVGEDVDPWRPDFRERFLPLVKDCKTPLEAATILNRSIWGILDVSYSTKREKHDQSPFHSMRIHIASCTGLSIILVNACRSVGIPARLVGCAWRKSPGNHTWVEVWSEGRWHFFGAFDGPEPNKGWFVDNASHAQPGTPYAIHAAQWKPTGLAFYNAPNTPARDITIRYIMSQPRTPDTVILTFNLCNPQGVRLVRPVKVIDAKTQKVLFTGKTHDHQFDFNDHLTYSVPIGQPLIITIGKEPPQTLTPTQDITLP